MSKILGCYLFLIVMILSGTGLAASATVGQLLPFATTTISADIVMLDLDSTLLKEVPVEFKNHPEVQSLWYAPGKAVIQKLQQRISEPPTPERVVHYEIEGKHIRSYVVVRPALIDKLTDLSALVKSGKLRVLITSANDPIRTQAVYDQLKLNGYLIKDLGFELVHRNLFINDFFEKDVSHLREELNIPKEKNVLAVDDAPAKIINLGNQDRIFAVTPWNFIESQTYLSSPKSPEATQFQSQDNRLMNQLENYLSPRQVIIRQCRQLFL